MPTAPTHRTYREVLVRAADAARAVPGVTDPWAVVSAYYGDIESGDYPGAWVLLGSGAVTGQTYQQFVAGFSCTGGQELAEQGTSGDQVSFTLAATDRCTGGVQHFSGTDTVSGGKIVEMNSIVDPERIRRLDLSVLGD